MQKTNVYQMVTDKIVEQLENGIVPWQCPWTGGDLNGGAINYVSRKPYSLLNQMLLGREGEWLTFKQVKDLGGSVKKGAKAGMVVFFTMVSSSSKKVTDENGEETEVISVKEYQRPILKYYHVFHINDCEGINSKISKVKGDDTLKPIERAEEVINNYVSREKTLKFQNDKPSSQAYYSKDEVVVPMLSQYDVVEEYYSTTFHELTHSTMTKERCNRKENDKKAAFGGEDYSREELVAELGSAMLCNATGIESEKAFKNSVAYIKGWLKSLKDDVNMIVWASSRAEKAAKYILNVNV